MMSLHRYLPSCVQSGGLQTLRDLVCCSSSHQVSQNNMLLLGVVQMVIGVLIVGSSFSAFFLSNFPAAIHNTSPYWAGLSGLLCGAVGVIAWKHNSMFTTTFYALLSSLCIVLNLLGAVLTSKISQNLVPIQNCPCFCCTSPDGCGAYFLPSSNAAAIHESLDVNKLPNKTSSSSSLSSFRSTHDNHHSAFNPQQQQLQYVKPLPTCEHEAETLRALMIVLCIENCLACAIATLSTIISLLLIAKNKVRLFPVA
ncbi:protein ENTREP2-like [Symsagittifera roscoffensis]|uniref:protein ENTREP2-like n=1 Tax=Symsagittifera roscoffensis TaxID=84072 RepID=UPI00307C4F2E